MSLSRLFRYILVLVAWLSISSASIIVILSGSSALLCAFWRLFFATLLVVLYSCVTKSVEFVRNLKAALLSVLSGVFLAVHFLSWMESLFYIPVSLSTTIVVLYPLMSMLYETALKVSRPKWSEFLGITIAFCGTVIAAQPYLAEKTLRGSALALLGALTGGAYFTIGRLLRKSGAGLASYTTVCYGASTVTVFVYAIISGQSILPAETGSWIYLLLLGLVPMLGGHTVINYLMKYMKSYIATVIGFGEAPGATILASLTLSQEVKLNVVIGMVIALSGALYAIAGSMKESEEV